MRPLETKSNETLPEIHNFFIQENVFEEMGCEMATILSRLRCVKFN